MNVYGRNNVAKCKNQDLFNFYANAFFLCHSSIPKCVGFSVSLKAPNGLQSWRKTGPATVHTQCSQGLVNLIQSCKDLTLWDMNLAVVSTWWIVSHLQALCGAAHRIVLLQFTQCHVGLAEARLWCCFSVYVPGPVWSGGVALCSLLGGIVPSWVCACLCYRPVCQDGDSFTLRDLHVPTVVHLWP